MFGINYWFIVAGVFALIFIFAVIRTLVVNAEAKKLNGNLAIIIKELKNSGFVATTGIRDRYTQIRIDPTHKMVAVCFFRDATIKKFGFSELIHCDIVQENQSVTTEGKIMATLKVKIITSNLTDPLIIIPAVTSVIETNSQAYSEGKKFAEEVQALMISVANQR